MKSFVVKIAKEEFGHMVLLAAFDVVDDTKFVQKVILNVRPALHIHVVKTLTSGWYLILFFSQLLHNNTQKYIILC